MYTCTHTHMQITHLYTHTQHTHTSTCGSISHGVLLQGFEGIQLFFQCGYVSRELKGEDCMPSRIFFFVIHVYAIREPLFLILKVRHP